MRRSLDPTPPEPETAIETVEDWRKNPVRRLQVKQHIATAMGAGVPRDRIIRAVSALVPDLSETEADKFYSQILRDWRDDYSRESTFHRATQIRRLTNDLVKMRSGAKVPWGAISRHEELLAKITGTMAPLRVAVLDVREELKTSIATTIGNMTDAELDSIIADGQAVPEPDVAAGS